MKYKWLLLDADNTLFDYDKAEATALQRTFEQFGHKFEPAYAKAYRRINHKIWLQFEQGQISQDRLRTRRFELLFEAVEIESDPVKFSVTYIQNLAKGAYLIDGAEQVVKSLVGRVGLMLITNGLKEVQRSRLARSTIADCFSDVVISDEIGVAKPEVGIFQVAFERMRNPKKADVLIVGDSLTSDIKGGNAYGIDTCWFNPDRLVCDQDVEIQYEIRRLDELRAIVGIG
ncbi:MAG: noncanonical pyrimidine nucleotidase, YjjG family [Chloroflexi bacterium]|nr:noncanonical pyrimidine nucleotidase, YjjG family [Chloroflexota bacterium]